MTLRFTSPLRKLFFLALLFIATIGKAQTPTFSCYITNEVVISPTVYQFDLYILRIGTTDFQYAQGQYCITFNSAVVNGGTISGSIVSGSSGLTSTSQDPPAVGVAATAANVINISAHAPPGAGNGFHISNVNNSCSAPGTRVGTFRLTNTVAYPLNATMNHTFNMTAGPGKIATSVFAYIGTTNTDITSSGTFYNYNTAGTCLQNITLAPTFNAYITNEVQVSSSIYRFDLYLLRTGGTAFEYAQGQFGISINTAVANGGTLTASVVAGSSTLSNASQVPNTVQSPLPIVGGSYYLNVAPRTPPGGGSGSIISNVNGGCASPGTRIATFQINNSTCFAAGTHMNDVFNFTAAANQTQTQVFCYLGTTNTDISSNGTYYSYNTAGTCDANIALSNCLLTVATSSSAPSCNGGSNGTASATSSGSSSTYHWSTGANTQSITGLSAGVYTVTVTDLCSCTATASATVTQPAALLANCGSTDEACTGGGLGSVSVTATGGTGPYTYVWSTGAITTTVSNRTAGNYSVTVTDSHGCTSVCTSTVHPCNHITMSLQNCAQTASNRFEFDLYVVSDGSANSDLRGNAFQFGVNFNTGILQSGATFSTTYIAGTSAFIPPLNTFTFPPAPDEIRIVESPYNGGNTGNKMIIGQQYRVGRFRVFSSASFACNSNPNFTLQNVVAANKTVCASVVYIDSSVSTTSFSVDGTASGQRSLSVSCSLTLNPPNMVLTTITDPTGCTGPPSGDAQVDVVSGGTGSYFYLWSNGAGTDQQVFNLSAGTYNVTVTDDAGCTATTSATVTTTPCNSTVNVKLFIQGYINTSGNLTQMKPVMLNELVGGATSSQCDTVVIELHATGGNSAAVESFKGVLSVTGNIACTFTGATIGNSYYIVVKHRNALTTWSAALVPITSVTNYDFSTAANQAFGSNQISTTAGFALFNGDVDQNGICNGNDFNAMETDVRISATGYKKTDITGDGICNGNDFNLLEGNVRASRQVLHP